MCTLKPSAASAASGESQRLPPENHFITAFAFFILGGLLAGQLVVSLMTRARGSVNEKAKRELGWAPSYASWRDGFRDWAKTGEQARAA